jgi:hypothetical protein
MFAAFGLGIWGSDLELPRGFERVSLERARGLLTGGRVAVVDALEVGTRDPGQVPGGIRWRVGQDGSIQTLEGTPDVPGGGVLVIASSDAVGYRSAARLSRAGNRPVYVFIPETLEERSMLASAGLADREVPRGEDS